MAAIREFEGKTKDDAVANACKELGVSEKEFKVEVLSYGSTGIFGLVGTKKAKIRVILPETPETEAVEEVPEAKPVKETPETSDEFDTPKGPEISDKTEDLDAVAELARKTVFDIISHMIDDPVVSVGKDDGGVRLKIEASNAAILIGRHGRTLDALQYVVRKIVRKKTNTKAPISFDVEGYRDRRKESLTQLALRLGEKVKRTGKPATISPMNAYDRRIVHVALKDDGKLRTQSRGGGLFRKLVIFPQKKPRQSKGSQQAAKSG
jgi:spoIIIJ-associated protein